MVSSDGKRQRSAVQRLTADNYMRHNNTILRQDGDLQCTKITAI